MGWFYRGRPFPKPRGFYGFVYEIERLDTGRVYIGQKKFTMARTRKPLKGRKNKRRHRVVSNWLEYYGSNKELLADVAKYGKRKFRREILYLCRSKSEMNYFELKEQILRDVLLRPRRFYNAYIGGRISSSQLKSLMRSGK